MKFRIPSPSQKKHLIADIGDLESTWEYRSAVAAVVLQAIIILGIVFWAWKRLPPAVPLWYSRPWGNDRLTSPWFLLLPGGTAIGMYIANILLVRRVGTDHPMFARILFLTSALVSALSCIVVIRIVTLVV